MGERTANPIHSEVASYYSNKLAQYGETPRGVDWNSADSQELRFEQLCRIFSDLEEFSLNDLGCGYGALYDFLSKKYPKFTYVGIDISREMIQAAQKIPRVGQQARFIVSDIPDGIADFGFASGIFNVRLQRPIAEWYVYLEKTLDVLDRTSRFGFAFNCLTSYADVEKMRDYLYYANPCEIFDLCKHRYSRNVALLHDYGLYEFTILVRK